MDTISVHPVHMGLQCPYCKTYTRWIHYHTKMYKEHVNCCRISRRRALAAKRKSDITTGGGNGGSENPKKRCRTVESIDPTDSTVRPSKRSRSTGGYSYFRSDNLQDYSDMIPLDVQQYMNETLRFDPTADNVKKVIRYARATYPDIDPSFDNSKYTKVQCHKWTAVIIKQVMYQYLIPIKLCEHLNDVLKVLYNRVKEMESNPNRNPLSDIV